MGLRAIAMSAALLLPSLLLVPRAIASTSSSSSPLSSKTLESNDDLAGDEEIDYDTIVSTLQQQDQRDQQATRLATKKATLTSDPFANIWMHAGIGWATSYESMNDARGKALDLNHKGIQATLGIDLFSSNWVAEGSARTMGDASDRGDTVSLKEFALQVLYKNRITGNLKYRAGAGLSGRYMNVQTADGASNSYTTPASVATLGLDLYLTHQFSVGIDTSFRNSFIADTVDHSSMDAVVRMDAHF